MYVRPTVNCIKSCLTFKVNKSRVKYVNLKTFANIEDQEFLYKEGNMKTTMMLTYSTMSPLKHFMKSNLMYRPYPPTKLRIRNPKGA